MLLLLGAANRDPRRWDRPDEYDLTRRTAGHVAFGSGIHMCMGQLLSRLEGEALLGALARQVASIEFAGPRCAATTTPCAHCPVCRCGCARRKTLLTERCQEGCAMVRPVPR